MKISSRGLRRPMVDCLWGWIVLLLLDETVDSFLCKDNISCNKTYIIKTLIFCVHILPVFMTT
jgi:hypothetical protein